MHGADKDHRRKVYANSKSQVSQDPLLRGRSCFGIVKNQSLLMSGSFVGPRKSFGVGAACVLYPFQAECNGHLMGLKVLRAA